MSLQDSSFLDRAKSFLEKNAILLGTLVIYGYYLFVSLDFFSAQKQKLEALDFLFQFDSLLLMWGAVYLVVKLQKYRKESKAEEDRKKVLMVDFERRRMELSTLDDITVLLNDRINNPLSIISLSTGSIRERLRGDDELVKDIDRMESGLKRVQEVMMGMEAYHAKKIVRLSKKLSGAEEERNLLGATPG